jgi:hypothetical protein
MMESGPVLCDIPSVKHKRAAPRRPEPQLEGYQYNARKRWLGRAATGSDGLGHAARAGADWLGRAAATGSDWLGLGRAARAGADWLGRPADPKLSTSTRLRAVSARSLRPSGLAMA